MNYNVIDRRTS